MSSGDQTLPPDPSDPPDLSDPERTVAPAIPTPRLPTNRIELPVYEPPPDRPRRTFRVAPWVVTALAVGLIAGFFIGRETAPRSPAPAVTSVRLSLARGPLSGQQCAPLVVEATVGISGAPTTVLYEWTYGPASRSPAGAVSVPAGHTAVRLSFSLPGQQSGAIALDVLSPTEDSSPRYSFHSDCSG